MKFKSIAFPAPSAGMKIRGKKITVPNQSMSLKEILERFTRQEALPIGGQISYEDLDDVDLSKVQFSDPVDRDEFVAKQVEIQVRFKREEKAREKERREKFLAEERERLRKEVKDEFDKNSGSAK